jgi:hypothetical protein
LAQAVEKLEAYSSEANHGKERERHKHQQEMRISPSFMEQFRLRLLSAQAKV